MPHTADTSPWRPFASLLLAMLLSSACIGMYAHDNRQHPIEAQYRQLSTLNAQSLLRYGETQTGIQADDRALVAFNILMSRYSAQMERQDKYACAKAACHIGNIYYMRCSYSKAMEYFLTSLKLCEDNGFSDMIPRIYNMIGNVYSMFNDFERSSMFYRKALAVARHSGDKSFVNRLLNNLICAYPTKEPLSRIKAYYREMAANREQRPRYHYNLLMDKGMILSYENRHREAIRWFRQSAHYAQEHQLGVECEGSSYTSMAESFLRLNQVDSALCYLHTNERLARENNQANLLAETLKKLYMLYEKRNLERALQYKSEYLDLNDSIYNITAFNHLKNAQFLYETNRSTDTINNLTLEKERKEMQLTMQRRWLVTLIACSLLFMVLLAVVIVQKRRLKASYNSLYERSKAMLTEENAYRQRIHDLKEQSPRPTSTTVPEEQRKAILACIMHTMEQTEDFCDSNFTIERLAEKAGTNTRYASQVINQVFGKNFRTLLNEYRIKEAMRRLMDDDTYGKLTIKAISESVGYKSQANFITVFTRITGIKPSMYQKLSREEKEKKINA
ncbi:helix-turn-helix domain-containing protein [Prevotella sp. CAG:592]|uniref:helix-turn-helix domain-containing protein n=1 Tax=Prevotella sp. CAG:592 TaxID=1262931 RepID=UPI00033E5D62|nr:helix-turn-helix domain-containing protein [Prevotella sp. CAG:592]CDD06362.1 transcription regulator araC/xylS [Prevotella sp. CAG:592]